jgi:hypothetical protein
LLLASTMMASLTMAKPKPEPKPRKPVGMCMPYAEICPHCTDCTQCGHCAKTKGKCSVCWDK